MLFRKDLAVIPQLQALTRNEMVALQKTQAELIIPILTKEKELVGLIILGRKLSQLEYSGEDERLITAVANRMATELENARLYDSEKNIRQQLEMQDRQKTEFLHSVAHELKTPLTAILSSSELQTGNLPIDPKLRKRLAVNVQKSALSMNRRVAELLDLARMQIGQLNIKLEPLEIDKVIAEVTGQLDITFASKKQTLIFEVPSSLPKVNADRGKIEQVLYNLLSNANKFSPTGSEITLKARNVGKKVIIEVEDSASPITAREKSRIFDPYYRSEDSMKRERFPGLGLGLSVSKRIVELHQGEIWVKNKAGRGNVFAFSLATSRSDN
ncbi:Adaptive-response sensory-kinase SasA [subsurface metagenome]